MEKIIKYEWRKQRTSRLIILFGLLICLVAFTMGTIFEKDNLAVTSVLIMVFGSFLVIFYTGIESLLVFNKDLRTKQSHMLWMIPKSTYEILGAKFLAALLQMLFVFVAFAAAGLASVMILAATSGEISMLFDFIQNAFASLFHMHINWGMTISVLTLIFLKWTLVIMTGFLAIILSRTLFLNSKFSGLFSVVLYVIITCLTERAFYSLGDILIGSNMDLALYPVMTYALIYYTLACAGLFGIAGVLADQKLSV